MIKINKEKAIYLHSLLSEATGGDPGLRDAALLESALASAFQTFGGAELYPTVIEKGARLGFSLVSNHAFVDGNKRIGILVMLTFLELNGVRISPTSDDLARVGLALAGGEMDYDELVEWIADNEA